MNRDKNKEQPVSPEERLIEYAKAEVDSLGDHPALTEVTGLLYAAQVLLEQWNEAGRPGEFEKVRRLKR
ncbi:hypothetical protein [Phaeobacter sp. 22II1-1F12B]|uniref:hypothetical protein n=1 Tax=Phaeobacter sp. 22II1-1F12B TaxID=1317111 RepID=UPI000B5202B9|nr:hypothetical protein [Phaeobacter sp. 22II1-1F12B]OWU70465.1 hypothetical protein ATO1_24005 [Phaeobacter sp. 22II1-1F12B]